MPRQSKPDGPRLQAVEDTDWTLDLPEDQRKAVMDERELTVDAFRKLLVPLQYCLPREDKPLPPGERERDHITDDSCRVWIDNPRKQRLNAVIPLILGLVEIRFFGPDQNLNACFFQACVKLGLSTRYTFGRASKAFAQSVLFKLREDEVAKLDDDYSGFKPRAFTLEGERRGVMINYAAPAKRGALPASVLVPGSLLWHADSVSYEMIKWRGEGGQAAGARHSTSAPTVEFFALVRAAAFASILNIVKTSVWQSAPARWSFAECLARIVLAGQAVNANVVFAKSARAIIAEPAHAELLIALIAEAKTLPETRDECIEKFRLAQSRLKADPNTHTVSGWAIIRQWFGGEAHDALRIALTVGADSTLLETFAERYLYCHGEFIDRQAHREGQDPFVFSKDELTLQHAPDQILTRKKPVEAFPIFIKSKMRQDVTGIEIHPDQDSGVILRVTRQGALTPNDDYAPEHSRLVFNEWAGLYIPPAKTVEAALRAECEDKLDHMLSLVTNSHKERAAWIKAHIGWTLKHPGQKQQVALVCTGDQGTGKSFLCTTFAEAVFGKYAGKGSVQAFDSPFYIPSYVRKLWVNHDEVVSEPKTIEIIKELIRSTTVQGQFKNKDVTSHTTYARLAFTSNEANPGLSRGADRALFQVTSITAVGERKLPGDFQALLNRTAKPFYKGFGAFLQRDDVRQAYVKLLIDCAPDEIAEVEDVKHSAMHDMNVASKHLTPEHLVAKRILETGTIWGGYDIAMPFAAGQLQGRAMKVASEIGVRGVNSDAVLDLFVEGGLLDMPKEEGKLFLFKFKIGTLQREFSKFLGVTLRSFWQLEPNDYMPNDYREGDSYEPWKGRGK